MGAVAAATHVLTPKSLTSHRCLAPPHLQGRFLIYPRTIFIDQQCIVFIKIEEQCIVSLFTWNSVQYNIIVEKTIFYKDLNIRK
jgi:hypothetical protein